MNISNLRVDFLRQMDNAGLRHIRFHDLRHTAVALMLRYKIPIITISKILGHTKVSTTIDIYGQLMPIMQEEAARIMDVIAIPIPVNFAETKKDA